MSQRKIRPSKLLVLGMLTSMVATPAFAGGLLCKQIFSPDASTVSERKERDVIQDNVDDVNLTPHKDMQRLAQTLIQTIEYNYGPKGLKRTTVGLDWESAKQKFLNEAGKARSEKELLFKISNFLFSFNDAHVSIQLPSSLKWTIPMQVSYAMDSNSYVLNFIDLQAAKSNLVAGELPPLGAELISINGKTPDEFRKANPALNATGNELTNKSMFGSKIFKLSEQSGISLSERENKGWNFEFQWKNADGQLVRKVTTLKYSLTGGGIIDIDTVLPATTPGVFDQLAKMLKDATPAPAPAPDKTTQEREALIKDVHNLFQTAIAFDKADTLVPPTAAPGKQLGTKYDIGQTKPLFKLPADFKPLELPPEMAGLFDPTQIFAGTFTKNGKRVALLRIPTYSITQVATAPLVIDYLIRRLEMSSDYMILDQMNNPGGAVVYSDFWIKAFVGKYDKSKHLHFRVKPTSKFLTQFRDLLLKFDTDSLLLPDKIRLPLLQEIRDQFEIVHAAYMAREPLSAPITLLPITKYMNLMLQLQLAKEAPKQGDLFADQPLHSISKPAQYTKPVYMLINQFDFSGGDATPASLQDYGRVKLVGTRTAGAGGTVEEFSSRELSLQFTYHLTTSLMYRPGNAKSPYVENYGVAPDIQFAPTAEDYVSGFSGYLDRLVNVIEQDLKK